MQNMSENQKYLENLVNSSIEQIKHLAETNTIIGNPIYSTSGNVIIPISKVSVGYVIGAGEYNSIAKKLPYPLAGGCGGGVSVSPVGFIVETSSEIKFIDIENKSAYQTILNLVNTILNKITQKESENEKD